MTVLLGKIHQEEVTSSLNVSVVTNVTKKVFPVTTCYSVPIVSIVTIVRRDVNA